MAFKRANLPERPNVPQLDRAIYASGCQRLVVRGDGYRIASPDMGIHQGDLLPGAHVPQSYRIIVAACGQFPSAVKKRHCFDTLCVPAEGGDLASRGDVPKLDFPISAP